MRKNNIFTNLTIICGDKSYPVHKVVLCSACHYFNTLLTNEVEEDATETVALQGIDRSVFEVLLEFMYSGRFLLKDFPIHQITELIPAIRKLGIFDAPEQLKNACSGLVDENNFDQIIRLADRIGSKSLLRAVHQFMINNLVQVTQSKRIVNLPDQDFQSFMMAAATNEKCNLENLLQSALVWMDHIPEKVPAFDQAISTLKFEYLSDAFCRFILEDEPLAKSNSFLRKKLVNALREKTPPQTDFESCERLRLRFAEGTESKDDGSQYSCSLVSMVSPDDVNTPSCGICPRPSVAVIGRDEANRASIVFYAIRTDEWTTVRDLGLSLDYSPGILYHNDRIYFIGGENMIRRDKICDAYVRDLATNKTVQLPDLRVPRSSPLVFYSEQGVLYAAGGLGRYGSSLSHVEGLDSMSSSSWRNIQPLREKRDTTAVSCMLNGRIYVLGGGTRRCEYYQESSRTWHDLPSLPSGIEQAIILAASINNHVYAFDYYKPLKMYRLIWEDEAAPYPKRMAGGGKARQSAGGGGGGSLCEWETINTRGQNPEWVTHASGFKDLIFALDKSHRFYTYSTTNNMWFLGPRLPKCLTHPCYINTVP